jgi:site-specific DNA recombinase
MGSRPKRAAIYARISSDQEGLALGVKRQLQDCRRLADELGWTVADEYVDNDVSAYRSKRRPAYDRLLADLQDGMRDAVLVYHQDRLTRRPMELERFVEVATAADVQVRFVAGAPVDVGDGDGLLVMRLMGAVAANESASKSRRVRRKLEQLAADGLPNGGCRPFGYEDDRMTVREGEAAVVRQLAARFVAGESLRSLCVWLNQNGVKTVKGGPWQSPTLRGLLSSARIAGLRSHRGEVIGDAAWEAIIAPADRAKVLARMESLKVSGRRSPRRYLLSGLLRCGRCDGRLFSSRRETSRRYVCMSGPDHGGCGRLTIVAEPVETWITEAVLYRLDTPELADRFAGRDPDDAQTVALSNALAADRAQLDELAGLYAAKEVTSREWIAARRPIEDRIIDAERRLARLTQHDALAALPAGDELRRQWEALPLPRQHAVIAAVLDHAVVAPSTVHVFDPSRVTPTWRL